MSLFEKVKSVFVKKVDDKSGPLSVDTVDIAKVVKTALLVGGATAITSVMQNLQPEMFGDHASVAALVLAVVGDFMVRFLKNNGVK
jgi:hypothetical protein